MAANPKAGRCLPRLVTICAMAGQGPTIRLTRHARNRMRWAKLSPEEVTLALTSPDLVTPGGPGRTNAWKETDRGWIRVTFIEEAGVLVVITATPRQRGPMGAKDAD